MKLVFCTDVVNGHYPLPSVLLWGYNLVHGQTRSGQASCNWHKMSGHAQQSGEDHTIQIRVLNSYFCHKLKIKEAKAQKYWKVIMWPPKTITKYLQFLFPFVHFYCSRSHIEKDHLIFQNIFEGQKFPIKIQTELKVLTTWGFPSTSHLPVIIRKPLSLWLSTFSIEIQQKPPFVKIFQDTSTHRLSKGMGRTEVLLLNLKKIVRYVPNFRQISGMSSSSIKESLEPRLEPTSCLAWNSL